MKSSKKLFCRAVCILIAALTLASFGTVCVSAASEPVSIAEVSVMPRYSNGAIVSNFFYISSSGLAEVDSRVSGTDGITTGATITIQLQRKTLLWWSDVDGGYWSNTFSGVTGSIYESLQLSKTGKYRAVITVTVSGTGGADDVIEETLTYEY